jgi:[ribosomal protein S18]-alanine N-acetyltransferase
MTAPGSARAAFAGLQRRPMTVRDLDAVLAAEVRAYSHPWSHGNFVDSLAAGYIAEAWYLDDEQGCATLAAYFIAMPGAGELHLLNVTVAPDWQGRGLGHAVLDAVQAIGRQRGFATLWLEVRESNARARALYRRLGFAELALRRGYYPASGRREDAVVMSLRLTADAPHSEARDAVD